MDDNQRRCLAEIRGRQCSRKYALDYYGLDLSDQALSREFNGWVQGFRRVDGLTGDKVDRYALESFLQHSRMMPLKLAAAHLGMDLATFRKVLAFLRGDFLIPPYPEASNEQLIAEDTVKNIHKCFPELAFTIFGSHSGFCRSVHKQLTERFGVIIKPLLCVTSEAIGGEEPDLAIMFDYITLEPMGVRYQVALNFGKPMNLYPDSCSMKFYFEEERLFSKVLLGGVEPRRPRGLRR